MVRRLIVGALCALLVAAGLQGAAGAQDPPLLPDTGPTIAGPVTGGGGVPIVFSGQPADVLVGRETFDLASVGYVQEEYFLTGTADAYAPAAGSTLTADGRWAVEPTRRRRSPRGSSSTAPSADATSTARWSSSG